jgi:hypothetical protein
VREAGAIGVLFQRCLLAKLVPAGPCNASYRFVCVLMCVPHCCCPLLQGQKILRQSIVTTFSCLVTALAADSVALHPFIMPIVGNCVANQQESSASTPAVLLARAAPSSPAILSFAGRARLHPSRGVALVAQPAFDLSQLHEGLTSIQVSRSQLATLIRFQELASLFERWPAWMHPGTVTAAKDSGCGVEDFDLLLQIAESHVLFGTPIFLSCEAT